ncbi:MAG: hypothetical protein K8E24_005390 [Methanobacterium paludis]|nr:hypothetical protein [Methanobacterium paludis]
MNILNLILGIIILVIGIYLCGIVGLAVIIPFIITYVGLSLVIAGISIGFVGLIGD